jgi:oligoendopeptidase F
MANKKLPAREEIEAKYKWKLEDIYPSDMAWEEDFKKVRQLSSKISEYKGKLAGNMQILLECLKLSDEMLALNDKVFVYARMRRDENNAESKYQALTDRAMALGTEVYASVSFIVPEIISIDEVLLKKGFDEVEGLSLYKQYFNEILRQKQHILSEREEELLALSAEIAEAPSDIFTMFNNADIKFGMVKDANGEEIELTKGR